MDQSELRIKIVDQSEESFVLTNQNTHQLEDEDSRADERSNDCPATDEEVAWVITNHVIQSQSESPMTKVSFYVFTSI